MHEAVTVDDPYRKAEFFTDRTWQSLLVSLLHSWATHIKGFSMMKVIWKGREVGINTLMVSYRVD